MTIRSFCNDMLLLSVFMLLGFSGCHSSFVKTFKKIAQEKQVNLYRLIVEVSALNGKNPSEQLICEVAETLK